MASTLSRVREQDLVLFLELVTSSNQMFGAESEDAGGVCFQVLLVASLKLLDDPFVRIGCKRSHPRIA